MVGQLRESRKPGLGLLEVAWQLMTSWWSHCEKIRLIWLTFGKLKSWTGMSHYESKIDVSAIENRIKLEFKLKCTMLGKVSSLNFETKQEFGRHIWKL